jgi:nitrate/TMAO reductase-like tetraheme cytochrome c subunit
MKKLFVLVVILLAASFMMAQPGKTVLGGNIVENWNNMAPNAGPNPLGGPGLGRHDLWSATNGSPLGCETCHLPHTAPTFGAAYLWAYKVVPASVQTYITTKNATGSMTFTGVRTASATRSILCMSCHDGASANTNGINGNVAKNGLPYALTQVGSTAGLSNQHPVDALVPNNLDYAIVTPVTSTVDSADSISATIGTNSLPLWGTDYRVECTSCHDQHNDYTVDQGVQGGAPFLRVANSTGVELCRSCHNK